MRVLIIAKPAAVQKGAVGEILSTIEKNNLNIAGIKAQAFDMHNLKMKQLKGEKEKELESALKIPAVLIVAEGKNAFMVAKEIVKKYSFDVFVSSGEETAKYEIARFFNEEELFAYDRAGKESVFAQKDYSWRKHRYESVEEIANKKIESGEQK